MTTFISERKSGCASQAKPMSKMSSPRKFSEKIALHNQKQAEETAAFEQIMKEVSIVSRVSDITDLLVPTSSFAVFSVCWAYGVPIHACVMHLYIPVVNYIMSLNGRAVYDARVCKYAHTTQMQC